MDEINYTLPKTDTPLYRTLANVLLKEEGDVHSLAFVLALRALIKKLEASLAHTYDPELYELFVSFREFEKWIMTGQQSNNTPTIS